ncbi:MAG: 6-phosphofructokinase [Candidatus Omnitrophica bacterium]|nr:6-phosphofructokinase [Candidatus Omnitrophota bacterium]
MKRIGVLTSGGDCSGMNACLRAVVRTALFRKKEVIGIIRGYEGLINGEFKPLGSRDVSGIVNLGGTILKTARSKRFLTKEGRRRAYKALKENNIEGLIVIGGDGSFRGADVFGKEFKFPVIGIPATIDNDIVGTDLTLGADTAVNVALDCIDKIRDTATSLERIFVIEVMGRDCGYIALETALAGGCEEVVIPEKSYDIDKMCDRIVEGNLRGKISWIIVVAEGAGKAEDIARKINKKTSLEVRITVLGHIQRGGRPTLKDRILGAKFGNFAVELLLQGKRGVCVGIQSEKLVTTSFKSAIDNKKWLDTGSYFRLIKILT